MPVPAFEAGSLAFVLVVAAAGCRTTQAPPAAAPPVIITDAVALVAETDRLAAKDLWPGFDPRVIPVAIYDGERTFLFRHPAPPAGFQPVSGREGMCTYRGRHPSVTANSSTDIAGVSTATLMPPTGDVSLERRAAVLIHEMFHVFQRERHPGWVANEAELFTYPMDNAELLALRRRETEALRQAMAARDDALAACWGRTSLAARRERFSRLTEGAVAYERGTELNEGLANYVESRSVGVPDSATIPARGFAPEALRQRSYATGTALARLLDRFSPEWRVSLERNDSIALDMLLSNALVAADANTSDCMFTPAERSRIQAGARADVEALRTRRAEQRTSFLGQSGWTLTVVAPQTPLFPQGFDPLNVQTVGPSEVLHTRWLKLGNDDGTVEVLGRAALTESAGAHPLFNGVRALTVAGLASEPNVTEANGIITVEAEGVSAELHGAAVERIGKTVTLRLASAE